MGSLPELSEAQEALVAQLTPEYVLQVDRALLAQAAPEWRRVARIVGAVMLGLGERQLGVPDVWYAKRVAALVAEGKLEARGELNQMRACEVRMKSR
jgi:hypothetical protein